MKGTEDFDETDPHNHPDIFYYPFLILHVPALELFSHRSLEKAIQATELPVLCLVQTLALHIAITSHAAHWAFEPCAGMFTCATDLACHGGQGRACHGRIGCEIGRYFEMHEVIIEIWVLCRKVLG